MAHGASATITSIGREIESSAYEQHAIKRADRLLSNPFLCHEIPSIYEAISQWTVADKKRPIILIDWSDMDAYKRHFLLRASLAFDGRSIPIYDEVHTIRTKEKPASHLQFLSQLYRHLPSDCDPIIVTDAGFKTPWFRQVLSFGWDFVGRTRLPNFYSMDGEQWQCITELYQQATTRPKTIEGYVAQRNPLPCRFVLIKQASKGRYAINRSGQRKQSKIAKTHRRTATDPWLLTTSLPGRSTTAKKIVAIYKQRMQIEESFRDMKSHCYGLGLQANLVKNRTRLSVLVLLTVLATLLTCLLGLVAQVANLCRRYQVNTVKSTRVLSLQFLGLRVIKKKMLFSKKQWLEAIHLFHQSIQIKTYEFI